MKDYIFRTLVPILVGAIVGQAARIGLALDPAAVLAIVTPAVTLLYATAARAVETQYPGVGRILLSLGLAKTAPTYYKTR